MKRRIVVATTNPGKIAELSAMLQANVEWLGLGDFDNIEEVVEDGVTFEQNARKKALGYAKQTGLWTIADDSGLVVDALGGEPGVRSSRYSGEKEKGADRSLIDHKNMEKVLHLLKDVPADARTARFVCSLCLASPDKVLAQTRGELEGLIAEKEIGRNGFGYDPVFFVPEKNKTAAQMTPAEKNAISHRGCAIGKLQPVLLELLDSE